MLLTGSAITASDNWSRPDKERQLEDLLRGMFTIDLESRVDYLTVSQKLRVTYNEAIKLLVDQVTKKHLKPRFFWECANGDVLQEADQVSDFDTDRTCKVCGLHEYLSTESVLVDFVIDPSFAISIRGGAH